MGSQDPAISSPLGASLPESMMALVFDVDTKTNDLRSVPLPRDLKPTQVLVRVAYVGICGTDLHAMKGEFPIKRGGVIMGHEISGVVAAVGADVDHVQPGAEVAIDPNRECGICSYCARSKTNFCQVLGINANTGLCQDGGFGEYVRVEAAQVSPLPSAISLRLGFLAETMSCIFRGRELLGMLDPDAKVLILGAGVIGTLWTSILHHEGQRDIIVTEPSEARRATVINLGLEGVRVMTPGEAGDDECLGKGDPDGTVDVVIDCCGVAAAIQPALKWVKRGGTLLVFAAAAPRENLSVNLFDVYYKELKIIGSHINPRTIVKALGLMRAMGDRYLNLEALGVKPYKLDDYQQCFDDLSSGKITKAYFDIKSSWADDV